MVHAGSDYPLFTSTLQTSLIDPPLDLENLLLHSQLMICDKTATVNQHPPVHHPLDACYYLVVGEPQLSQYLVSPW
jgi:hypothetical protein